MSKKSRRRNQLLGALALGIGASKLGMLGGKTDVSKMITSGGGGKDMGAKKFLKSAIGKGTDGITKLSRSDLPSKRNMKSIFVGDDGTITKGLEKFKNKEAYSTAMKSRRGETGIGKGLKNFLNKVVLGPKTQLNMGGEAKVKTKLNGTLKTKTY
jgi:hypothetical protein